MMRSFPLRSALRKFDFARVAMADRSASVCMVDRQGRFTMVNPGAERMLGWAEAGLLGKDLHATVHRCGVTDSETGCPLHDAARAKTLFRRGDDILRRKDGTKISVSYLASPVVLDGQVEGTVFVFQDMTQREQELLELRESEERYRYLAEASPEPMWLTDAYGYITMANTRAAELLGYNSWGQMVQLNALELFTLEDRPRAVQARNQAAKEGTLSTAEYQLAVKQQPDRHGASTVTAEVRISPVLDVDGRLKAVLYAARDTGKEQEIEDERVRAPLTVMTLEQAVAVALSGSNLLGDTIPRVLQTISEYGNWDVATYWQVDTEFQVLRCHTFWHAADVNVPEFEELCQQLSFAPGVDLPGRAWSRNEPVWVDDVVADSDILRALMASKEGIHAGFCIPVSAGGALQGVMEFMSRDIRTAEPSTMRAADSVSAQIGWFLERHQAERELRYQALHDSLTGLPNRALLLDRVRRALFVARETGKPLVLFLLDLDRFKGVNDSHGHAVGDELLQQVARRLQDTLRDSDTVARLGGDEFAVLLPGTNEAGAVIVAQKIVAALHDPFNVDGVHLEIGGSMGIAVYPDHGEEPSALLQGADAAMYVAKRRKTGYAIHSGTSEQRGDLDPASPGYSIR